VKTSLSRTRPSSFSGTGRRTGLLDRRSLLGAAVAAHRVRWRPRKGAAQCVACKATPAIPGSSTLRRCTSSDRFNMIRGPLRSAVLYAAVASATEALNHDSFGCLIRPATEGLLGPAHTMVLGRNQAARAACESCCDACCKSSMEKNLPSDTIASRWIPYTVLESASHFASCTVCIIA
jgi:hypothetical protein